jgi:hypothetical protein
LALVIVSVVIIEGLGLESDSCVKIMF